MTSKRKLAVPEVKADEIVDYLLSKSIFNKACKEVFDTFQDTLEISTFPNIDPKALEERRRKDRERQRKRRSKFSEEQLEKKRQYDREYKAKRKMEVTWKTRKNMSQRELRKERKAVRIRVNRFREKQKKLRKQELAIINDMPHESDSQETVTEVEKEHELDVSKSKRMQGSYKYLKNIGLHQISTATKWNTTPCEVVQKTARIHYNKIRSVTSTVEDEFDKIIQEKLNGPLRSLVKEEILKFLREKSLLSNSEHDDDKAKSSYNEKIVVKEEKEEDSEMSSDAFDGVPGKSTENYFYLDDISFSSPSSVHTSDLSSFEDEISISSEEGRTKRKVSSSFAEEELKRCRENKTLETPESSPKKEVNVKIKNEVIENLQSSDAHTTSRNSSCCIRKPDSKYFSSDVLSPFDIDSMPNTNSPKISTPRG